MNGYTDLAKDEKGTKEVPGKQWNDSDSARVAISVFLT